MQGLDAEALATYQSQRRPIARSSFCFAPFGSMNFNQDGIVTACCFNREQVYGSYPKDTLVEIWQSATARELRKGVRHFAPPDGCWLCAKLVNSGNHSGTRALYFDSLAPAPEHSEDLFPQMMEFEMSNLCNLECIMCNGHFSSSIRKNRDKLPPKSNPYDDSFVDHLMPFMPKLKDAKFLGGEPFLNRLYFKIWDRMLEVNPAINVHIVTNGTILTPKIKRVLARLKPHIVMSVDSLDRENYERIRANANYDEMRENLVFFRDHVRTHGGSFRLSICPMQQNWRDLPDLVNFCNQNEIGLFLNTMTEPANAALTRLPLEDRREVSRFLEKRLEPVGTPIAQNNNQKYIDLIHQLRHPTGATAAP